MQNSHRSLEISRYRGGIGIRGLLSVSAISYRGYRYVMLTICSFHVSWIRLRILRNGELER